VRDAAYVPRPHSGIPLRVNGFTVVFSLIGSIFYNVRIYAYPNSGGWYDFGFVLGVVAFFSAAPLLHTKFPAATTAPVELTPAARASEMVRQTFSFYCSLVPYLSRCLCRALPVAVRRCEGLDADERLVGIHTRGNLAD
jgi:hypothetical protein